MVNQLLKECMNNGLLLDKELRKLLDELLEEEGVLVIKSISKSGINNKILSKKLFEENINEIKKNLIEVSSENVALEVFSKIGYGSDSVNINKVNSEDVENSSKGVEKDESLVKILSTSTFVPRKIFVSDFVNHFKDRYEKLKEILEKKEFENLTSIRKIGRNEGNYTIIVAVVDKRVTKNKNILLEVEDLTGSSKVLINNSKSQLFGVGEQLMMDDIIAININGGGDILFANKIVYPGASIPQKKYSINDNSIAIISDIHIGSKMFLKKNFLKFIKWLNGEIGDNSQKELARKIRYLFVVGNAVNGINRYPGQEKDLDIKTTVGQYGRLEELLRLIRSDIQIIMCPGQHDAVWVGEPQLAVNKKFTSGLYDMENLHLVSNPSLIELESNFKILMYHGASINHFINEISEIRIKYKHNSPTRVAKEMLKRRHLAPTHGLMDYIPFEKDCLTIEEIPDILLTGSQHRAEVSMMNNILLIASSCWQSITSFEEKVGNNPDPCKVPIFNLKTREIKILDFSGEEEAISREVCCAEEEGVTCDINSGDFVSDNEVGNSGGVDIK
jgi:DNA polymerase II small subunit